MDRKRISLSGIVTSYTFYRELLRKVRTHYVSEEKKPILFDLSRVTAIDALVLSNLLCLGYVIKKSSGHTPQLQISNNIAEGGLRKFLNDSGFITISERYDLFSFLEGVKYGFSGDIPSELCTVVSFNPDESGIMSWSKLATVLTELSQEHIRRGFLDESFTVARNLTYEIAHGVIENAKTHGNSFVIAMVSFDVESNRLRLSFSDCGIGFYAAAKDAYDISSELEAILSCVFHRKNEPVYGLYGAIKAALSNRNSVVRVHSMVTQIAFTPDLFAELNTAENSEQRLRILGSDAYRGCVTSDLWLGGVHIEFDISL